MALFEVLIILIQNTTLKCRGLMKAGGQAGGQTGSRGEGTKEKVSMSTECQVETISQSKHIYIMIFLGY